MKVFLFLMRSLFSGIAISTAIYVYIMLKNKTAIYWWLFYVFGFSFATFVLLCVMFGW